MYRRRCLSRRGRSKCRFIKLSCKFFDMESAIWSHRSFPLKLSYDTTILLMRIWIKGFLWVCSYCRCRSCRSQSLFAIDQVELLEYFGEVLLVLEEKYAISCYLKNASYESKVGPIFVSVACLFNETYYKHCLKYLLDVKQLVKHHQMIHIHQDDDSEGHVKVDVTI